MLTIVTLRISILSTGDSKALKSYPIKKFVERLSTSSKAAFNTQSKGIQFKPSSPDQPSPLPSSKKTVLSSSCSSSSSSPSSPECHVMVQRDDNEEVEKCPGKCHDPSSGLCKFVLNAPSTHIQHIQCTSNAPPMHLQCTSNAPPMRL